MAEQRVRHCIDFIVFLSVDAAGRLHLVAARRAASSFVHDDPVPVCRPLIQTAGVPSKRYLAEISFCLVDSALRLEGSWRH